jgi:hypothetical protein
MVFVIAFFIPVIFLTWSLSDVPVRGGKTTFEDYELAVEED